MRRAFCMSASCVVDAERSLKDQGCRVDDINLVGGALLDG